MLSIGELSRRTGVKVPTIRYYEDIGLDASTERTQGNQRRYDKTGLRRLAIIRHARNLGLPLGSIRALIDREDDVGGLCDRAHHIAKDHSDGTCAVLDALGDPIDCAGPHGVIQSTL